MNHSAITREGSARKHNRRRFIKNAAAGGAGLLLLKNSRLAFGYAANERLRVAIIGCGGRGSGFVGEKQGDRPWDIAALCDVNEQKGAAAFKNFPDVPRGHDYRVMFDKYCQKIDAVIIGASDHAHAPASATAIKLGKPVYCEKPLTVKVREARALARLAAENKVATQMGNQGGYSPKGVNIVWSGMLGDVLESYNWMESRGPGRRPLPSLCQEIPRSFRWDLWLGPAPYREHNTAWWQGWNSWREFGTSGLGNRGSHSLASMFKSLNIGSLWPPDGQTLEYKPGGHIIKVSTECSDLCIYSYPRWEKMLWQVPARGSMPPVNVRWYMGEARTFYEEQGLRAKLEDMLGRKTRWGDQTAESPWGDFLGSLLVGSKGQVLFGGYSGLMEDKESAPKGYREQFASVEPPNKLPSPLGKSGTDGWVDAIKGGPAAMNSFDGFSGPYNEFLMLGHLATMFPGEELEFDTASCRIINNSLADLALDRERRPGWPL